MSVSERSRGYSEVEGEAETDGCMLWYECDMNSLIRDITNQQRSCGNIDSHKFTLP